MLPIIERDAFLALTLISSATLDQRTRAKEAAFALGCERPAHIGEYLAGLDPFAMILGSMLHHFMRLTLRQSAEIVREHWQGWLDLLIKTEHTTSECPQAWFCVAWREPNNYIVALGTTEEIAAQIGGIETTAPVFMPMTMPLNALRANARTAGITLPDPITPDPKDEAATTKWWADIEDYRLTAGVRAERKRLVKA